LEDYDENNDKSNDQANDIETLSDQNLYTSEEEDDKLTEEDNESEESEILEDISDGIFIISCNLNINY